VSRRLIALFGPTGVGKTDIALALARRLRARGELPVAVSADALQVYRGLEILTGAPTCAQLRELEHRLVSFLDITESFSAGRYAQLAHAEIDSLVACGHTPLVVGGTGLYLRAALADLDLRPPPLAGARERWTAALERRGAFELHAALARRAPTLAAQVDWRDRTRLLRALELHEAGVTPAAKTNSQLWTAVTRHPTRLIGLTMAREALYERIDARVLQMVSSGARAQVIAADAAGASPTARAALGFAELLHGDIEAMKRRTRRYAKRQVTWMGKLAGVELFDVGERSPDEVAQALDKIAGERGLGPWDDDRGRET